jgi:hypothetical protein
VDAHAADYPDCAHLAEHGWIEVPNEEIEAELETVADECADPDLAGVTAQLLAAVRAAPPGATALIITDGEAGDLDDPKPDD